MRSVVLPLVIGATLASAEDEPPGGMAFRLEARGY